MATVRLRASSDEATEPAGLARLTLGALGIVYGDIGTSPLYALKEAFGDHGGLTPDRASVLGVLSLIFWFLIVIVTLKYVVLILRADNRGEGGVLAVSALALRGAGRTPRARAVIVGLSVVGLAFFYGDGLITPAISVLSAVEGLEIATPAFGPSVLPISVAVLVGLFVLQQFGTARVGALFGPVMLLWFTILAVLGVMQIARDPEVRLALDPRWALAFFADHPLTAFISLGAIVLAVTGAEALYADMGHFGPRPIRIAWLGLVLPALTLNYYGQGALLLEHPEAVANPFYLLAPGWLLIPLVVVATSATIIASQALISGVFSLTRQACQLGYLPRMTIRHTSATEAGQIYMPQMNWLLLLGVIVTVLGFQRSSNLAAAYGITVTGTMGITTILAGIVAARIWGWGWAVAIAVFGTLLLIDVALVGANALKIPAGGWFPIVVAGIVTFVIATWRGGRKLLWQRLYSQALPISSFLDKTNASAQRVAGTAVFMTGNPHVVPNALLHNLKHNKVLHERVVLMRVDTLDEPWVPNSERLEVERLGKGFFRLEVRYGFMDQPDVPKALELCRAQGLVVDPMLTSFFLGRETLIASGRPEMGPLRERLFIALSTSAVPATAYFGIPPDRVVELGTQIEI